MESLSMREATNATVSQLYVANHHWLLSWLLKKLHCPNRAADIAHDTFERLLRKHTALNICDEPRAILTTIAKGLVIDHTRRQILETAYLNSLAYLPQSEIPSVELQAILLETLIEVDRMLNSLPVKARRVFLMSQLDGMTYPQIAQAMNISLSSVQKYMTCAYAACYKVRYQD